MDSGNLIELIGGLEERYPTNEWTVEGLRVWPLLRVRFYTSLVYHFLGSGAEGAGHVGGPGRVWRAARSLARLASNQLTDAGNNAWPSRSVDAVFLSDGVSWAQVGGRWYDRFMDPIIAELTPRRIKPLLLMPMARGAVPRHTPSLYIQPLLDGIKLSATAFAVARPVRHFHLDGLDALRAELSAVAPEIPLAGPSWVIQQARRVEAMSRFFGRIIKRTSARAAFANTYYSAEAMAFILAAKRLGITTVDVQHGNQRQHVAYGGWRNIPADGFELLPDQFWCWGADEVAAINNGPGAHPAHRAVEVGNVWEHAWRSGLLRRALESDPKVREALAKAANGRNYLVTPSTGHSDEDLDLLLRMIAQGGGRINWWLRLHPNQNNARDFVGARLQELGAENVQLELATQIPLPTILSFADVNITQASSTVVEARNAGVPSVITTQFGASIFVGEIAGGTSGFADCPTDILKLAERFAELRPAMAFATTAPSGALDDAIEALFAARGGERSD